MEKQKTSYQRLLEDRFLENVSRDDQDTLRGLGEIPEEEGIEDEMEEFLKENPECTIQDMMQHMVQVLNWIPMDIEEDD